MVVLHLLYSFVATAMIRKRVNIRDNQNFWKWIPDTIGEYDIPKIKKCEDIPVERIIPITQIRDVKPFEGTVGCFYVDDFQMERFWQSPARYVPYLRGLYAVIGTDFSIYSDMPRALAIFNCYRNFWLTAYWQNEGIGVIPNITWPVGRLETVYFEAIQKQEIIAVSNVGLNKEEMSIFETELQEVIAQKEPKQVLLYGKKTTMENEIIKHFPSFSPKERMKNEQGRKR